MVGKMWESNDFLNIICMGFGMVQTHIFVTLLEILAGSQWLL